jgi:hypothetical protein
MINLCQQIILVSHANYLLYLDLILFLYYIAVYQLSSSFELEGVFFYVTLCHRLAIRHVSHLIRQLLAYRHGYSQSKQIFSIFGFTLTLATPLYYLDLHSN